MAQNADQLCAIRDTQLSEYCYIKIWFTKLYITGFITVEKAL